MPRKRYQEPIAIEKAILLVTEALMPKWSDNQLKYFQITIEQPLSRHRQILIKYFASKGLGIVIKKPDYDVDTMPGFTFFCTNNNWTLKQ